MDEKLRVTAFFERAGLRLNQTRKSWGAADPHLILLRTWEQDSPPSRRSVVVLRQSSHHDDLSHSGLRERLLHVKQLWHGGISGYTVIWEAQDPSAHPRKGKPFAEPIVYPIEGLRVTREGIVEARLGDAMSLDEMRRHSRSHRTARARTATL